MDEAWFERLLTAIERDARPAREISLAAGLGQNYVQQMIKRQQPPKLATLDALLDALGPEATKYVRDGLGSSLGPAVARTGNVPPFGGFPQAGNWAAVDEYFQQDVYDVPEFVLRQPAYSKVRQYAYQVRGNSMNQAGIEDGMWVVAADALEFVDTYRETESGDLVVVERTRFQGAERELTIKEVRYYRDRMELLPRSSDPSFKPIVVPLKGDADDGMEVKIIGVVLTSYRDHMRRP